MVSHEWPYGLPYVKLMTCICIIINSWPFKCFLPHCLLCTSHRLRIVLQIVLRSGSCGVPPGSRLAVTLRIITFWPSLSQLSAKTKQHFWSTCGVRTGIQIFSKTTDTMGTNDVADLKIEEATLRRKVGIRLNPNS